MNSNQSTRRRIVVVAAVVEVDGRFLVTRRPRGTHLEGLWEFPGGKVDDGETYAEALVREIREELGAEAVPGDLILQTSHDYPDRSVELFFYRCRIEGSPSPQFGQEMRWVAGGELASLGFPPADAELIALLRTRSG
jgi:8-oxo-dGTP diphosphatase